MEGQNYDALAVAPTGEDRAITTPAIAGPRFPLLVLPVNSDAYNKSVADTNALEKEICTPFEGIVRTAGFQDEVLFKSSNFKEFFRLFDTHAESSFTDYYNGMTTLVNTVPLPSHFFPTVVRAHDFVTKVLFKSIDMKDFVFQFWEFSTSTYPEVFERSIYSALNEHSALNEEKLDGEIEDTSAAPSLFIVKNLLEEFRECYRDASEYKANSELRFDQEVEVIKEDYMLYLEETIRRFGGFVAALEKSDQDKDAEILRKDAKILSLEALSRGNGNPPDSGLIPDPAVNPNVDVLPRSGVPRHLEREAGYCSRSWDIVQLLSDPKANNNTTIEATNLDGTLDDTGVYPVFSYFKPPPIKETLSRQGIVKFRQGTANLKPYGFVHGAHKFIGTLAQVCKAAGLFQQLFTPTVIWNERLRCPKCEYRFATPSMLEEHLFHTRFSDDIEDCHKFEALSFANRFHYSLTTFTILDDEFLELLERTRVSTDVTWGLSPEDGSPPVTFDVLSPDGIPGHSLINTTTEGAKMRTSMLEARHLLHHVQRMVDWMATDFGKRATVTSRLPGVGESMYLPILKPLINWPNRLTQNDQQETGSAGI